MAATATLIKNPDFNVNTTTLNEFIDMYIEESKPKDPVKYASDFRGIKSLKPFLNKPIAELVEASADPKTSPYGKFYDTKFKELGDTKKFSSAVRKVKSSFTVIQDNYDQNVNFLKLPKTNIDLLSGRITPKKIPGRGKTVNVDPDLVGELQVGIMEHVKKFPADSEIGRAIFMTMYTGLRPQEITGLRVGDIVFKQGSASAGIKQLDTKMQKVAGINVPIGPYTYALAQQQMLRLSEQGVELTSNTPLFTMPKKKLADEMTRVLKNINVPGIRVVAETGEALDTITAYDLRRLYLTGGDGEGFSEEQLDKSVGRATGKTETSKTYVSPVAGKYKEAQTQVSKRMNDFYFRQLENQVSKNTPLPDRHRLDFNNDLIKVALGEVELQSVPINQDVVIKTYIEPSKIKYEKAEVSAPTPDDEDVQFGENKLKLPKHLADVFKPIIKGLPYVGFGLGVAEVARTSKLSAEEYQYGYFGKIPRVVYETVSTVAPVDPTLGMAGQKLFPTKEEAQASVESKDFYEEQREETRKQIRSQLGQSIRTGSDNPNFNNFLNMEENNATR